jgi:cytochrome P450
MFDFDLTKILLTIFSIASVHVLVKYILKPFYQIYCYEKQGLKAYYMPFIGDIKLKSDSILTHGDSMYPLKSWIKQDKNYKGLVTTLGYKPYIKLGDPQLIRQFSQTQYENYVKYPFTVTLMKSLANSGLVFVDGDVHKKLKRLLSNSFHFEFLKKNIQTMLTVVKEKFEELEKEKELKSCNVQAAMEDITGESISKIFFGNLKANQVYKGKKLTNATADLLARMCLTTASFSNIFFGVWFIKLGLFADHKVLIEDMKCLRQIAANNVKSKKEELIRNGIDPNAKDLLTLLIKDQLNNSSEAMTDEEITDQYATLFGAGMDTTAHLLTMVLYFLAMYPEVLNTLRYEIKHVIPDINAITYEQIAKLDYMSAIMKETLRLKSPSQEQFIREAIKDHKLGDIKIKKGTLFNVSLTAGCYNEKNFPDNEKFNPARWFSDKNTPGLDNFTYTPFFAGSRNCIGQHLAQIETKLVVAYVVTHYDIALTDPEFKLRMCSRFLYEPYEKIHLTFTKIHSTSKL